MLAERETNDRLIAHFLADRIGATSTAASPASPAPACSSSSTKLAPTVSSRPAPSATEYFRFEEAARALVGSRSGRPTGWAIRSL